MVSLHVPSAFKFQKHLFYCVFYLFFVFRVGSEGCQFLKIAAATLYCIHFWRLLIAVVAAADSLCLGLCDCDGQRNCLHSVISVCCSCCWGDVTVDVNYFNAHLFRCSLARNYHVHWHTFHLTSLIVVVFCCCDFFRLNTELINSRVPMIL